MRKLVVFLFLVFQLLGCQNKPQNVEFTFRIQVKGYGGKALPGIRVDLGNWNNIVAAGFSDSTGYVEFKLIAPRTTRFFYNVRGNEKYWGIPEKEKVGKVTVDEEFSLGGENLHYDGATEWLNPKTWLNLELENIAPFDTIRELYIQSPLYYGLWTKSIIFNDTNFIIASSHRYSRISVNLKKNKSEINKEITFASQPWDTATYTLQY